MYLHWKTIVTQRCKTWNQPLHTILIFISRFVFSRRRCAHILGIEHYRVCGPLCSEHHLGFESLDIYFLVKNDIQFERNFLADNWIHRVTLPRSHVKSMRARAFSPFDRGDLGTQLSLIKSEGVFFVYMCLPDMIRYFEKGLGEDRCS